MKHAKPIVVGKQKNIKGEQNFEKLRDQKGRKEDGRHPNDPGLDA